jgi:hypothetical protein
VNTVMNFVLHKMRGILPRDSLSPSSQSVQISHHPLWEFSGFYSGIADDSFILGYDAASLGNRFPTFRYNVMASF